MIDIILHQGVKVGSDGLFQFLRWPESDLSAGRDRDGCPGRRVSSGSRRSCSDFQDTEAGQADFVTLLDPTSTVWPKKHRFISALSF
jgi:hypothetical protein